MKPDQNRRRPSVLSAERSTAIRTETEERLEQATPHVHGRPLRRLIALYRPPGAQDTLAAGDHAVVEVRVSETTIPWGVTRMRPYPAAVVLPAATVVLDPTTQTGRWIGPDGLDIPVMDKHKKSETSNETKMKTSLDGEPDEGSDQEGDSD